MHGIAKFNWIFECHMVMAYGVSVRQYSTIFFTVFFVVDDSNLNFSWFSDFEDFYATIWIYKPHFFHHTTKILSKNLQFKNQPQKPLQKNHRNYSWKINQPFQTHEFSPALIRIEASKFNTFFCFWNLRFSFASDWGKLIIYGQEKMMIHDGITEKN